MIWRIVLLLCCVSSLLLTGCSSGKPPVEAVSSPLKKTDGPYRSYVSIPCDKVVAGIQDKDQRGSYLLVVKGFMTGTSFAKGRTAQFDNNVMLNRVENYCRQNPRRLFNDALVALDHSADRVGTPEGLPLMPEQQPKAANNTGAVNANAQVQRAGGVQSPAKPAVAQQGSASAQKASAPALQNAPGPSSARASTAVSPATAPQAIVPGTPASATETDHYAVLLLSTKSEKEALQHADKLKQKNVPASAELFRTSDDITLYRVIAGPYVDRRSAIAMRDQLVKAGYASAIVTRR